MDQLKDELVKDMSDQIEESIQGIETTLETKLEVDIIEPKIYKIENYENVKFVKNHPDLGVDGCNVP